MTPKSLHRPALRAQRAPRSRSRHGIASDSREYADSGQRHKVPQQSCIIRLCDVQFGLSRWEVALLSKSKILAYRQCPRRLWLEVHRPDLKDEGTGPAIAIAAGQEVGALARDLYDPAGTGRLINLPRLGFPAAFSATMQALETRKPIFEGSFSAGRALALADILLPAKARARTAAWRMVEVKSAASVKDVHRDDLALQAHVVRSAGVDLSAVALAHIDSAWVYPGDGRYEGLLTEVDLTDEVAQRSHEAQSWIVEASRIADQPAMPDATTGSQCSHPYDCGFYGYCSSLEPQVEMPISWLPRLSKQIWVAQGVRDMRDIPDDALNDVQRRVRDCTVGDKIYFDRKGAKADLAEHILPGYFLDFETIQFAVPVWAGTRPYQQIPFQYSLHVLTPQGSLDHAEFLDLSGGDPSRPFAEHLIGHCANRGPVFVYHASFETSRLAELAQRFPDLARRLEAIRARVVDLLPIARNRYYHPAQEGSWSIKAVLPAAVPGLSYRKLDGVQNGGDAQQAFLEAIRVETRAERRTVLRQQLLAYCALDTYAMVRLWQVFAGRTRWRL